MRLTDNPIAKRPQGRIIECVARVCEEIVIFMVLARNGKRIAQTLGVSALPRHNQAMLTINETRFLSEMADLWQIGATADGGVTRRAFSAEDLLAREWFKQRVLAAGLKFRRDGAGNQYGTLHSTRHPNARTLLVGSHLDTVPNGGRYDGALGVMSALEAVRSIKESGASLPLHLEVVNFTDEEGTMSGLFGSQAVAGILTQDNFANARGGVDALEAGMARLGTSAESTLAARRNPDELAGFLELHIEQDSRLEEGGISIGVVNSIVGIRGAWMTFTGEAAHAGAMPMAKRRDALWGASTFVLRARELVQTQFHPGVCNVGEISVTPGAFNIVPAQAKLAMEFRHGTEEQMDAMQVALFELAEGISAEFNLNLQIEPTESCSAVPSNEKMLQSIETAATKLGVSHQRMLSFAGHDTQSMATITPSAMIFVPSVDGISHNPEEYTKPEDCIKGANVVLQTLLAYTDLYQSA